MGLDNNKVWIINVNRGGSSKGPGLNSFHSTLSNSQQISFSAPTFSSTLFTIERQSWIHYIWHLISPLASPADTIKRFHPTLPFLCGLNRSPRVPAPTHSLNYDVLFPVVSLALPLAALPPCRRLMNISQASRERPPSLSSPSQTPLWLPAPITYGCAKATV
jgi:hypothetical protein